MEYCIGLPSWYFLMVINSSFVTFRGQNMECCQNVIKCDKVRWSVIQYGKSAKQCGRVQQSINQSAKRYQQLLILALFTYRLLYRFGLFFLLGFAYFDLSFQYLFFLWTIYTCYKHCPFSCQQIVLSKLDQLCCNSIHLLQQYPTVNFSRQNNQITYVQLL